ncbi:uncharacterized protein LOC133181505 [Saccostrea echinata]|uniref:uncharacterized protein LOC133181505 n=1 Tax=Saccostrea echinata TaxID=191078 RepID=UPI002A83B69F|nr:uncharacterized protein LOC133181505 [Saccostrea echinata]
MVYDFTLKKCSEKLGGWLAQNQLSLSEELYLGGYHTPSLLTTESPTFLPFSGCVRELTFRGKKQWYSLYKEYRLSQDTVMQDKLRRGLLKSCDVTELCNFTITAKNLTANLNQLCHWPGSEVAITAEVVPNCSSDPQIAYQWTVHYLYGFFTTISEFSKYSVLSTTPLNRSSLILTVGNQQADLPIGVYGINLTVVLNSGINATAVTILGYFIVGCTDVTDLQDPDCSHIQDIITHDILISTKLSDTSHCKGQSVVTGGSYVHPTEFWELEQEARNILLNSSANTIIEHPSFQLKCLFNCEDKAVPGQTLLLQSLCDSCQSHTWTVYGCGTQCDVLIGPPQNGYNFTISVNESYEQQQIFYTGTYMSGRNVSAQYNLTVNLPPIPGNCTITPQSGYSLVTAFSVSCRGFTDPDLPLSYVIYQRRPSGMETELMKSDEALISPLYLSEGPKENNYTQRLTVKCMDSRGLMSATPITVQVTT